jgi:hypothetical protein
MICKWNTSFLNSTDHAYKMAAFKDEMALEIHTLALAPKLH